MSETNVIYDSEGNIVANIRLGVVWCSKSKEKLGEYTSEHIYDSNKKLVANIKNGCVVNNAGNILGKIKNKDIIINNNVVGKVTGSVEAASAAIALIFSVSK